jgi:hypothetical protein
VPLVVAEVSHLSLDEEPLSGLGKLHDEPESTQYGVAVVVKTGVYDEPNSVAVRVGAE